MENSARQSPQVDTSGNVNAQRSYIYALLSALLASPADASLVGVINRCNIQSDSWENLKTHFQNTDLAVLDDEYHRLFIGVSTGELLPYKSHYVAGCLMGKPLSELREDIQALGLSVQEQQKNPEDHIAGIFEIMRLVIDDLMLSFEQQKQFFDKHILTWVDDFFNDLINIKDAHSYPLVAYFGQWFIQVEKYYFS